MALTLQELQNWHLNQRILWRRGAMLDNLPSEVAAGLRKDCETSAEFHDQAVQLLERCKDTDDYNN